MATKIEWTDEVWNPVTGCTKVSQGCKNCYAEQIYERFNPGKKFTEVICHEDRLEIPLHWKKPRRIFVNSMSDLFHENITYEFIKRVFVKMGQAHQHIYQILTKRPKDMCQIINRFYYENQEFPMSNVWLGVSIENQAMADERIPWLLKTPAAVRFVSYEPALGPVDFSQWFRCCPSCGQPRPESEYISCAYCESYSDWRGIDWIIAGGESGPGARPMHPDWARSARDQCVEASVPFFFKQWGEWIPVFESEWERYAIKHPNGLYEHVGKKRAGRLLDGREWNEYPNK